MTRKRNFCSNVKKAICVLKITGTIELFIEVNKYIPGNITGAISFLLNITGAIAPVAPVLNTPLVYKEQ